MKTVFSTCVFIVALAVGPLYSQDAPPISQTTEKHEWLQKFVGEWRSEAKTAEGPEMPSMECEGTIHCRSLGDLWIVSDFKSEMGGITVEAVQTIGYDPEKEKYVGTWIDSMVNYLWEYEGTLDEDGQKLTLEADGPNFMLDGKLTKFRDIYEFKSDDEIAFSSAMQTEDGEWITFMSGTSRRDE